MRRPDGPPLPDFGALTDEELVLLARGGTTLAAEALLTRCFPMILHLIGRLVRRGHFRHAEAEDAGQEAVLVYLEALAAYHRRKDGGTETCFRTFLSRRARQRLIDWGRRKRRAELRMDRSADLAAALERRALRSRRDAGGPVRPDLESGDPAVLAVWREDQERLAAGLHALDGTERSLLEGRAKGRPLSRIAADLELSYDQAKRLFQNLMAQLRGAVA